MPLRTPFRSAALLLVAGLFAACGGETSPPATMPAEPAPFALAPAAHDGPPPPAIVLVIGDGMGPGILAATSQWAHGAPERLSVYDLPHRGLLTTLTGPGDDPTDSAAAGTAMACGVFTSLEFVGVDTMGQPVGNVVELARKHGLATGIVTTASLTHATPAAFTVHAGSRWTEIDIADRLVRESGVDVMLGGGAQFFLPAGPASVREDRGLVGDLRAAGYALALDRRDLGVVRGDSRRVAGLFAPRHLPHDIEHDEYPDVPRLYELAEAAVAILDRHPAGFFLMVEGGRIDMAAHDKRLDRTLGETLALDVAVARLARFVEAHGNATLIVTADHDTGDLRVLGARGAGQLPEVAWTTKEHTTIPVDVFASGPATEVFDGTTHDLRFVHAVVRARITGAPFTPPAD